MASQYGNAGGNISYQPPGNGQGNFGQSTFYQTQPSTWGYQDNNSTGFPSYNTAQNNQFRKQYIQGRMINEERDITANEIPTDGSFAVFIQQDLKKIYTKAWGGDGVVHGDTYELVRPDGAAPQQDPIMLIMQRLDRIEETLKKGQGRPYYQNRNHKKVNKSKEENNNA